MGSVGRLGSHEPHRPRRLVSNHVDRPVRCRCRRDHARSIQTGCAGCGWPHTGPLACLPRYRLVDQSADRSPPRKADSGSDPLSAEAFPEDLGVLRDVCRPRRSLAAAGQLSGASRSRGRASHVADQHGTCACWRICPRTTSATFRPENSSNERRRHSIPCKAWNDTEATSLTGTTPNL